MKNIRCLFLIFFVFIAFIPVTATNYDQKIIGYLNDSLAKSNGSGGDSCLPLFQYLQSQERNASFQAYLKAKHLKMNLSETSVGPGGQVEIYQEKQHYTKIHLYPFLSQKAATLASFDSLQDPEFLALPASLRAYYAQLYKETEIEKQKGSPVGGEVTKSQSPDRLGELLPDFKKGQFWLVSPQRRIPGDVESLNLTTWVERGSYRIDLRFKNPLNYTLFAFHTESGNVIPTILFPQILPRQLPPGMTRRGIVAVPIAPRSTVIYIASMDNTERCFNLLWDWKRKCILYFDMASGYSLGNESERLTRNYLLEYKNHFYLLRNADNLRYSELVYFGGKYLERVPLADIRATEI